MNPIHSLLIISIVAGFITSTISFFLIRGNWHTKLKKNQISCLNQIFTNIYQFNSKFLGAVSLSVSIAASIIIGNFLFIIFYCDSLSFVFCDVAKIFLAIIGIRIFSLLIVYSFFYDKNLIEN